MTAKDRITATVTFNQRNGQTVRDAHRFVQMILDETPVVAEADFSSTYDGETVTFNIAMNGRNMEDFNAALRLLCGERGGSWDGQPTDNGILHYMGVGLTETRKRWTGEAE